MRSRTVVLESQIQGLEDLNGYFVQQDKVVPIRFKPQPKKIVASGLIERVIPATQHRPLDPDPIRKSAVRGAQDPSVEGVPKASQTRTEEQLSIGMDMLG